MSDEELAANEFTVTSRLERQIGHYEAVCHVIIVDTHKQDGRVI